ncbi:MAG: anhydro-N-acetylmuramic acid kinase [Elainellaceae cyanobacterium]
MRIVGLISGTSVDGIDAVLVELTGTTHDLNLELIAGDTYPYPHELRHHILEVCHGAALSMDALAELDDAIAQCFAQAALNIQQGHMAAELVGSHGQTVFHRPPRVSAHHPLGYSLQLGRGALIAHLTEIPTVGNFRAADIALGGQGAPLVPAVDLWLLGHPTLHRCIQNIGGIGNVAYLPPQSSTLNPAQHFTVRHNIQKTGVLGWDTGPGNALIDVAVFELSNGEHTYDDNGRWAAEGTPCDALVQQWLHDDYLHQPPPKSTGRELFGADYARRCLAEAGDRGLSAADTLASLTDFTAASIALNYRMFLPRLPDQIVLCGGGSRNGYLADRLRSHLPDVDLLTTDELGIDAAYKEAIAMAVLAYWRWHDQPGNLPEVTGAEQTVPLGEIYRTAQR